ncbi:WecB/TagA/CpsF family glycosyltransferase [Dehalobacterium formicoaceticum]|uniref:N-acetylglucosaminyldiphosphoundecaprenol N-acetyl-beta-D-mannosaminyltransferase n=1 Tax=Dehalobacterium formicoaceticum TaxID=51515 RepID=A0ABT1Y3G6_9FIRM|nr:WecB/TagA/CpsF family glycosyltransferase [Dehalobacterium formicoaceticum]MCR6545413.1 WecB/TagA/CpsF family glycosyltransferase [Dehalobacterium formicoaceticum]
MASLKILGVRVDKVDMLEALCLVDSYIQEGSFHHVITLNAEIIYQAQSNEELKDLINGADLVTPDGSGIVWAAGYLGEPVAERVTGIDLMLEICKQAHHNGWRIFLLGGAPGVAEEAAQALKKDQPNINIVGTHHGYFQQREEEAMLAQIRKAEPDLIFVALGAPRQEFWIRAHREQLPVKIAIGVGGSFDVVSGRVKRAPLWMQKMKLEWLARLLKEPWRFKRMLSLPKFVLMVIKSKSELEAKKKLEKKKKLP